MGRHWRLWPLSLAITLIPVLTISIGYQLNLHYADVDSGITACNPFLAGCLSISRALRAPPAVYLFRTLMLPCALLLALHWWGLVRWLRQTRHIRKGTPPLLAAGLIGAAFLALYAVFIGTDGAFYQWLRRLGITFFFAGTGIAQLLCARVLYGLPEPATRTCAQQLQALCALEVLLGLGHTYAKLRLALPDRYENIAEWWLALLLVLGFAALARWQWRLGMRLGRIEL